MASKLGKIYQCNAEQVRVAMRKRYAPPEWALFFEVANATGSATRYADAIGMSLWSSRGLGLTGFEIKVRRGDWLKELKDPAKADAIAQYCNFWYVVAAKGIVILDEVPELWGLIELDGRGLRIVKKAPKQEAEPVSIQFLAALLRRAGEFDRSELREHLKHRTAADEAKVEERIQAAGKRASEQYSRLRRDVDAFEHASGLKISGYGGDRLGRAVALVNKIGAENLDSEAVRLRNQARAFVIGIDKLLGEEPKNG